MIHNHERLLVNLIEQYYGRVPSLTGQLLLHHGSILMKRALAYSKLNKADFKRGLDVLVRCSLAKITTINRRQILEIDNGRILNLLFYPQYLTVVRNQFGQESELLLRTLILYGNLSIENLIERTLFHIILKNQELEISEEQMKVYIDVLFDKYKGLCIKRIICRVDKANYIPDECNTDEILALLKKRLERNPSQLKSFVGRTSWTFDCNVLNFLFFIELFPHFANQRFVNEEASFLFNLLLEMTFDKSFKMEKTTLVYHEIFAKYTEKYPSVNISRLSSIIKMFTYFFAPNFVHVEKTGCSLNFEAFLEDIVKVVVKEFVKKNFGENAVRIFGALLEESCIFENSLLNSLKMDSKELHRNLYQLDLNRMINITFYSEANQSATISAKNIKKAFSVDLLDVVTYILNRCYYSVYTIRHRRHIEMSEQKELLARKEYIEHHIKEKKIAMEDSDERTEIIKAIHSNMSENDHKKSETVLSYSGKVDKVDYHMANYIFILSTWKQFELSREKDGDIDMD